MAIRLIELAVDLLLSRNVAEFGGQNVEITIKGLVEFFVFRILSSRLYGILFYCLLPGLDDL